MRRVSAADTARRNTLDSNPQTLKPKAAMQRNSPWPLTLSPSQPLTVSPSHPLILSPSHPLTLAPSHPLTLTPSHSLTLQGYLAHKKTPPPRTLCLGAYGGPGGLAFSYARGTPVPPSHPLTVSPSHPLTSPPSHPLTLHVRTGSWMGPPQGERAPRAGPICIVIPAGPICNVILGPICIVILTLQPCGELLPPAGPAPDGIYGWWTVYMVGGR